MTKLNVLNMLKEATSERSSGSNFSGVMIPFLKVVPGKTRLLFLSDLEDESNQYPDVKFYHSYPIPGGVRLNNTLTYDVAYVKGDPIHEIHVNSKRKEGKEPNPDYFSLKGYAYVVNLTALKGVNFYIENGKMPTRNDFNKDMPETKAAKEYINQYVEAKQKHEQRREELLNRDDNPIDIGEFVYHGIFIYNFPVSITKAIYSYAEDLVNDDVDPDDISLRDYVFALNKEGTGQNTSYSLTPDFEADQVDNSLLEVTNEFIENNESLSDFEGLINRKRNKSDDEELEEEFKVSNVPTEARNW